MNNLYENNLIGNRQSQTSLVSNPKSIDHVYTQRYTSSQQINTIVSSDHLTSHRNFKPNFSRVFSIHSREDAYREKINTKILYPRFCTREAVFFGRCCSGMDPCEPASSLIPAGVGWQGVGRLFGRGSAFRPGDNGLHNESIGHHYCYRLLYVCVVCIFEKAHFRCPLWLLIGRCVDRRFIVIKPDRIYDLQFDGNKIIIGLVR